MLIIKHECTICKTHFDEKELVGNEIYIGNGKRVNYAEVCDDCIKIIADTIDDLKPKQEKVFKEGEIEAIMKAGTRIHDLVSSDMIGNSDEPVN